MALKAAAPRLKNLSLRQLRYFPEVAQLHSFTRAAIAESHAHLVATIARDSSTLPPGYKAA